MQEFTVKDTQGEVLKSIVNSGGYGNIDLSESLKNFTFHEFTLEELGLPSAEEILQKISHIKELVGTQGWMNKDTESKVYKGFSLTYNPDFLDQDASLFHQTWGSKFLNQNFARRYGLGDHTQTKNTYYDSYAFRKIHPIIEENLGSFLKRFRFSLLRSRVAYYYGYGENPKKTTIMHVDEFPYELLRVNIPLQTSEEYVLDIIGNDDHKNSLNILNKHLEVGKAYLWNTRIPHRICLSKYARSRNPRIHLVLGFSPWFDYIEENDSFIKNAFFGRSIKEIVESKLFMN